MKTLHTSKQKQAKNLIGIVLLFLITLCSTNISYGQDNQNKERIVKGLINNEEGPLPGANVLLKGSRIGIDTDENGKFTFPEALNVGDILLISYLGYVTQEIKIKETTAFIPLTLNEDLVELIGALDTGKPYKSKRSN